MPDSTSLQSFRKQLSHPQHHYQGAEATKMRQTKLHGAYRVRAVNKWEAEPKRARFLLCVVSSTFTAWTLTISVCAQRTPPPQIIGPPSSEARFARWDLTVSNGRDKYPAW